MGKGREDERTTQRNMEENHRKREEDIGFQSWTEATTVATERDQWRRLVDCPILIKDIRK